MKEIDEDQYNVAHPLARRWLAVRHGTRWSDTTIAAYSSYARNFLAHLEEYEENLLTTDIEVVINFIEHLVRMGRAESTVTGYHSTIADLYRFIHVRTDNDPVLDPYSLKEIDVKSYSYQQGFERDALTRKEVKNLLNNFENERGRVMTYLAVCTGIRNREVRNIKLDDINYGELMLHISNAKGGKSYDVPLPRSVSRQLIQWENVTRKSYHDHKSNEYMFPSRMGGKLKVHKPFCESVKAAAERAGIQKVIGETKYYDVTRKKEIHRKFYRVTPHALRHTYITLLKKADAPDEARQKAVNHSSIEMTRNYEHVDENHDELIRSAFNSGF